MRQAADKNRPVVGKKANGYQYGKLIFFLTFNLSLKTRDTRQNVGKWSLTNYWLLSVYLFPGRKYQTVYGKEEIDKLYERQANYRKEDTAQTNYEKKDIAQTHYGKEHIP